jgi:hypothetical protein
MAGRRPPPKGVLALTPARTMPGSAAWGEGECDRGGEAEVSVSVHDAWSRLISAGWLPQDRVFGWSGALVLERVGKVSSGG